MFDYIAYLLVQQRTAEGAHEALPDSPAQVPKRARRAGRAGHSIRHAVSTGLRWVADRLEPARDRPQAASADCR